MPGKNIMRDNCLLCNEDTTVICQDCFDEYNYFCKDCYGQFHKHFNRTSHEHCIKYKKEECRICGINTNLHKSSENDILCRGCFQKRVDDDETAKNLQKQHCQATGVHVGETGSHAEHQPNETLPTEACDMCGEVKRDSVHCATCDQFFCSSCGAQYHKHKKRMHHELIPTCVYLKSKVDKTMENVHENKLGSRIDEGITKEQHQRPSLDNEREHSFEQNKNGTIENQMQIQEDHFSSSGKVTISVSSNNTGARPKENKNTKLLGNVNKGTGGLLTDETKSRRQINASESVSSQNWHKSSVYMELSKPDHNLQGQISPKLQHTEDKMVRSVPHASSTLTKSKDPGITCVICMQQYSLQEIEAMQHCEHSLCKNCAISHFTNMIQDDNILRLTCPVCSQPNLHEMDKIAVEAYFTIMDTYLNNVLEGTIHCQFLQKLSEWRQNSESKTSISTKPTMDVNKTNTNMICHYCRSRYAVVICRESDSCFCEICDKLHNQQDLKHKQKDKVVSNEQMDSSKYSKKELSNICANGKRDREKDIQSLLQNSRTLLDGVTYNDAQEAFDNSNGDMKKALKKLQNTKISKNTNELEDMDWETSQQQRTNDATHQGGSFLKHAKSLGFTMDELQVAMMVTVGGKEGDPVDWLNYKWHALVHLLREKAKKHFPRVVCFEESKEALIKHSGDITAALVELVNKGQLESHNERRHRSRSGNDDSGLNARPQMAAKLDKPIQDFQNSKDSEILQPVTRGYDKSMMNNSENCRNYSERYEPKSQEVIHAPQAIGNTNKQQSALSGNTPPVYGFQRELLKEVNHTFSKSEKRDDYQQKTSEFYVDHKQHNLSYEKIEMFYKLKSMGFSEAQSIIGVKNSIDVEHAILNIPETMTCGMCAKHDIQHDVIVFLRCVHRCCKDCGTGYFSNQIRYKYIVDMVCPMCKEPRDLANKDIAEKYFQDLTKLLNNLLFPKVMDAFNTELTFHKLKMDPNFYSCGKCGNGFIINPDCIKLECNVCKETVCAKCKITWESEHAERSCEEFMNWKLGTEMETNTVINFLKNEIQCPRCTTSQGCRDYGRQVLHFKCTLCNFEFCRMCGSSLTEQFVTGGTASNMGHYRNCYLYLSSIVIHKLETLLESRKIPFLGQNHRRTNKSNFSPTSQNSSLTMRPPLKCRVSILVETNKSLVSVPCDDEVSILYAGVCRVHYVQYLTKLIIANQIDPLELLAREQMVKVLTNADILVTCKTHCPEETYMAILYDTIQSKVPLFKGQVILQQNMENRIQLRSGTSYSDAVKQN